MVLSWKRPSPPWAARLGWRNGGELKSDADSGVLSGLSILQSLLATQRDERIESCRAPGRHVAGQQRNPKKQRCDDGYRRRVAGPDSVQQVAQESRDSERTSHANEAAGERQAQSVPENIAEHVAGGRTKREADAEFTRALPD